MKFWRVFFTVDDKRWFTDIEAEDENAIREIMRERKYENAEAWFLADAPTTRR